MPVSTRAAALVGARGHLPHGPVHDGGGGQRRDPAAQRHHPSPAIRVHPVREEDNECTAGRIEPD